MLVIILSCQKDEIDGGAGIQSFGPVTAIAEDNFEIYQIKISGSDDEVSYLNLSELLGFEGFDFLNIHKSELTFFQVLADDFNVFQFNTETSETFIKSGLCTLALNEFRQGVLVSDQLIGYVSTEDGSGFANNYLNTFHKQTGNCSKTSLGYGNVVGRRIVYDNMLYFTLVAVDGRFLLKRFDLDTMNVVDELSFESIFKATLDDEHLYVFYYDNSYEIFNRDNFELLSEGTLDISLLDPRSGFFDALIKDQILYTEIDYQQPSPLAAGPATVNLAQGQYVDGTDEFANDLRQRLSNYFSDNIELTDFAFDLENEMIIYGYDIGPQGGAGGIVYTNFDGEILKVVPLQYVPSIILQN